MVAIHEKILMPVGTAITMLASGKIGLGAARHPDRVHVMGPDDETDESDRNQRVYHSEIAEDRLAAERGNDVADDAEAWQYHDVNLGMTEEPEKMLIQHRIAAALRREKRCSEIAIGQKHCNRAGEHRQRQQQQESRHQDRPGEQRHFVQGHARRPHIENGGDEIDRAEDRRRTRDVH